jgi:hypothetical protein
VRHCAVRNDTADSMVTVSEETAVDYELTAKIAIEAFALGDVHFSAERIKWLYERAFGRGRSCSPRSTTAARSDRSR